MASAQFFQNLLPVFFPFSKIVIRHDNIERRILHDTYNVRSTRNHFQVLWKNPERSEHITRGTSDGRRVICDKDPLVYIPYFRPRTGHRLKEIHRLRKVIEVRKQVHRKEMSVLYPRMDKKQIYKKHHALAGVFSVFSSCGRYFFSRKYRSYHFFASASLFSTTRSSPAPSSRGLTRSVNAPL